MTQTMKSGLAAPASILALDGGGTYTRALIITREGQITAHAEGPGCNPFDRPDWADSLRALLERLPRHGLIAAGLGMAGYDAERPSCMAQENLVRAILGPDVALCLENDVETAHRGAFAGGPGLFLLAGTGSVVMARTAEGRSARAGGWGWLLGDEGSGYWLGRKALRHAAHCLDTPHAPDPTFAHALLHRLGLPLPDSILTLAPPTIAAITTRPEAANALREWLRTRAHPRSAIAELAVFVAQQAETGSPTAMALLRRAAEHLAAQAQATTDQLDETTALHWSYGGSVMRSPFLRNALTTLLERAPHPPRLPPLGGAALSAARLAGWPCEPDWISTLAHNLHRHAASSLPEPTA